jgi:hypothetical protein
MTYRAPVKRAAQRKRTVIGRISNMPEKSESEAREHGQLTSEARRIAEEYGVSLRQAYRYATAGRVPADTVRIGVDGKRYHVHESELPYDEVKVRRIRYMVTTVANRACQHGITRDDLAELDLAAAHIAKLADTWRAYVCGDAGRV